jgi:hypothetical protein
MAEADLAHERRNRVARRSEFASCALHQKSGWEFTDVRQSRTFDRFQKKDRSTG